MVRLNIVFLIKGVLLPAMVGGAGYTAVKVNWRAAVKAYVTGPGRTSRILLLLFALFNLKNMPFAWTFRVFYTYVNHAYLRRSPVLGPRALFKPIVSTTHAPLLEIDYNLHKSNSTFFSDLDITRSHLVCYLLRPALGKLSDNSASKMVLDPASGKPMRGNMGIMLGAAQCTFRREVAAYQPFEMWTRVLAWDRKWLFIITHIMPPGAAKPTEWLDPRYKGLRTRGSGDSAGGWERKIIATAVQKYVFKVGRFTVHPALILAESGLLPDRPGGWTSGDAQLGDLSADLGDINLAVEGEWDWRRVEAQRRKGMDMADKFQLLDDAQSLFDGGSQGALARVWPG